jgi:hypothetical protein
MRWIPVSDDYMVTAPFRQARQQQLAVPVHHDDRRNWVVCDESLVPTTLSNNKLDACLLSLSLHCRNPERGFTYDWSSQRTEWFFACATSVNWSSDLSCAHGTRGSSMGSVIIVVKWRGTTGSWWQRWMTPPAAMNVLSLLDIIFVHRLLLLPKPSGRVGLLSPPVVAAAVAAPVAATPTPIHL